MSIRTLILSLASLVLALSFVPVFAFAQSYNPVYGQAYNCGTNTNWWTTNWNNANNANNANCTNGQLLVYVQVLNGNSSYAYNQAPSAFTVTVNGQNASPSSFAGSLSGTPVSVLGSYSVQAIQLSGYSASYSTGCNGSIVNGQQATCVITENTTSYYSPYPTPYPYPYYNQQLSCTPSFQTVNLGQTVTFNAEGGDYSQYNWSANNRSYLNVGPSLNIVMENTGTQTVTVTNGTATASCTVDVVYSGAPVSVINPINTVQPITTIATSYPNVVVTPSYIPRLPNTGYEPLFSAAGASTLAFALVLLMAAAIAAYPYVRQAFAVVLR